MQVVHQRRFNSYGFMGACGGGAQFKSGDFLVHFPGPQGEFLLGMVLWQGGFNRQMICSVVHGLASSPASHCLLHPSVRHQPPHCRKTFLRPFLVPQGEGVGKEQRNRFLNTAITVSLRIYLCVCLDTRNPAILLHACLANRFEKEESSGSPTAPSAQCRLQTWLV